MFSRLRQLVVSFFVYNLVNVVVSFHVFVDVCVSLRIAAAGKLKSGSTSETHLGGYERTAAAFLFFDFLLSILACVFAVKAVDEARRQRGPPARACPCARADRRPLSLRARRADQGQEAGRVHEADHRDGAAAVRRPSSPDVLRAAREAALLR